MSRNRSPDSSLVLPATSRHPLSAVLIGPVHHFGKQTDSPPRLYSVALRFEPALIARIFQYPIIFSCRQDAPSLGSVNTRGWFAPKGRWAFVDWTLTVVDWSFHFLRIFGFTVPEKRVLASQLITYHFNEAILQRRVSYCRFPYITVFIGYLVTAALRDE